MADSVPRIDTGGERRCSNPRWKRHQKWETERELIPFWHPILTVSQD